MIAPILDEDDRLEECFQRISGLMYDISGVRLPPSKMGLVRSRLRKRLRALGLPGFPEYVALIESATGRDEMSTMVDLLTTNKTSFFRESAHFDYIWNELMPQVRESGSRLKIWCAGCSSGEEPYSLSILLREGLPRFGRDTVKILATDLSNRVLHMAREGVYDERVVETVDEGMKRRHFNKTSKDGREVFQVVDAVRSVVTFARLNLMTEWPMRGRFDLIMCRNVMIYFDRETRQRLVGRFSEMLRDGGYLFVGHSEGLNNLQHELSYVQPAVYRR